MQLDILDVLSQELPKELKGAFDVVHLRAFAVVIKGGDPKEVLNTLVGMLSMLTPLRFLFLYSLLSFLQSSSLLIFCFSFLSWPLQTASG